MKVRSRLVLILTLVFAAITVTLIQARAKAGGTEEFTLVAVEIDQTKFWLPSTIAVHAGDHVKLHLKNMIPGKTPHGFELKDFKVSEVVDPGREKTVEFDTPEVGVYRYTCQLHPAHIGGQIIVEAAKH